MNFAVNQMWMLFLHENGILFVDVFCLFLIIFDRLNGRNDNIRNVQSEDMTRHGIWLWYEVAMNDELITINGQTDNAEADSYLKQ